MKDKSGRQETVIIQDSVNTDTVIKKNTAFFGAGGRGTAIGTRWAARITVGIIISY